ncbi:uncharacterized protein RCO7_09938 [Rhynchosporium graminicola]|uniref:Uncharacterized protein n=1 Tax=Rhynchosporium graminicola TaxID=2792576 RepID=A0A1E1LL61_9HELO|nr:uncharacterized protein RCO7_09938 [Rhynchosporium commune]
MLLVSQAPTNNRPGNIPGSSRADRRLFNRDATMWWNQAGQQQTDPSSDRCWQCNVARRAKYCSLITTGYPCTLCAAAGRGAECRNGLPSVDFERSLLENVFNARLPTRQGGQSRLYISGGGPSGMGSGGNGNGGMGSGGMGNSGMGGNGGNGNNSSGVGYNTYVPDVSPYQPPAGNSTSGFGPSLGNPNTGFGPPPGNSQGSMGSGPSGRPSTSPQSLNSSGGGPSRRHRPRRTPIAGSASSSRPSNRRQPVAGTPYGASRPGRRDEPEQDDYASPYMDVDPEEMQPRDATLGICVRCKRLNLICNPERPCQNCLKSFSVCRDNDLMRPFLPSRNGSGLGPDIGSPPRGDGNLYGPIPVSRSRSGNANSNDRALAWEDIYAANGADDSGNRESLEYNALPERGIEGQPIDASAQERRGNLDLSNIALAYNITPPLPGMADAEYEDSIDRIIETGVLAAQTWMGRGEPQLSMTEEERQLVDPALLESDMIEAQERRTASDRLRAYQMYRADRPRAQPQSMETPNVFQGARQVVAMHLGGPLAPALALWQPRIPPPVSNRPLLNLPPFASWNWEGVEGDNSIRGPSTWPFTRISPQQPHGGRYSIYIDNRDENCMEAPRAVALPQRFADDYDENINGPKKKYKKGDLCGDKPSRPCECIDAARVEHRQNDFMTCVPCHEIRYNRRGNQGVNLKRRKAYLCRQCADLAIAGNCTDMPIGLDCVCQTTMKETWLCHLHRDVVDQEFVAGVANAEAVLIAMGVEEKCISCGLNGPERNSEVFSCKICRGWVNFRRPTPAPVGMQFR